MAAEVMRTAIDFMKESLATNQSMNAHVTTVRKAANLAICKLAEKLADERRSSESLDALWNDAVSAVEAYRSLRD